ncbi:MAG: DegT/DnrJ/EryC1/StrS aminotransferase family protein [Sumerlaeia bacterium]
MNWKVPLTTIRLGDEEKEAVCRVLDSGWLAMGPEVEAFEHEFAAAHAAQFAVACSNGTDALAMAYDAMGADRGDEVAMPALTFVASLNVALRRGEQPILVDIAAEDDLTLSPADLATKITPRTRLIVSMPYGGYPPDMESLRRIADHHSIPLIEDACHAPLVKYQDRYIGTFGDAGCFSFFTNKNITTGEGGMILTNDRAIAERVRLMRNHGMTRTTRDHYEGAFNQYDVLVAGHNFRMDEMRAAIGRVQLRKLPEFNRKRREISARIRTLIQEKCPDLIFPNVGLRDTGASHHLLAAILPKSGPSRETFMRRMTQHGIQTSVHYRPLHQFNHTLGIWSDPPRLPNLEAIADRLVTLPLGPDFTDEQVELVAKAAVMSLGGGS